MEELLKSRQIDTLYHFTRAKNLENILKYGLMPRQYLEEKGIFSSCNDMYRYDNCLNAVCMSIEFPNYQMFYKYRMEDKAEDWAVIKLDAKILCDFECAYCWANAGSALMYNIPIEQRKGKNAFLQLFGDWPGYPQRKYLNIGDWYPTNPQAEVLVFGEIPVYYIKEICFESTIIQRKYINVIPEEINVKVNNSVFMYRDDWKYW